MFMRKFHEKKRKKLDEKAIKLKFVGYDECTKGYRLLNIVTNKIIISRDVQFINDKNVCSIENYISKPEEIVVKLSKINGCEIEQAVCDEFVENSDSESEYDSIQNSETEDDFIGFPRRSERLARKVLNSTALSVQNCEEDEPKTYKEALTCSNKEKWEIAMKEEVNAILKNETWTLVDSSDLPEGKKPIGCKWVYKIKRNVGGEAVRFKARLVAQGFSQKYGTDYNEVFAPVARQTTFRTLLSVAAKRNLFVKHFDAKTAFLNGDLQEQIYMKLPPGFENTLGNTKVCMLKKSLYGLKQSARVWNNTLHKVLVKMGFKHSSADSCLYIGNINKKLCYILIYVDDLVVVCEEENTIKSIHNELNKHFEIVSLGDIRHYLGMDIERDEEGNFLINQTHYIEDIIKSAGLQDAKISKIPIDPGYHKIDSTNSKMCDQKLYQKFIGQLLYVSVSSRPDISSSISILSQKLSSPNELDMNEVKRVLRYLKGNSKLKLQLSQNNSTVSNLIGYSDADWAECRTDRKSNSGFIFKFNHGTISWACRKQSCVTLSSTEAELVALCEASKEAIWLRRLLFDLGEVQQQSTIIFEDNQSCIKQLQSEKFSNRTKHVDTKFHFIKDLNDKELTFIYCPTEDMVADILTKPLQRVRTEKLRHLCGLH